MSFYIPGILAILIGMVIGCWITPKDLGIETIKKACLPVAGVGENRV